MIRSRIRHILQNIGIGVLVDGRIMHQRNMEIEKMIKETAVEMCQEIKRYLCAGNPVWNTEVIAEVMDMAIEALQAQLSEESTTKNTTFWKWIPCSEALPDTESVVLAIIDGKDRYMVFKHAVVIAEYYGKEVWMVQDHECMTPSCVYAWMPIPDYDL